MGLFDRFKRKEPGKPRVFKRTYAAAGTNRLLNDFFSSERSPDSELRPAIKLMRSRARELTRNNEYAKRYITLMKDNVVGERGFTLQVKARNIDGALDQDGNDRVEGAFRRWGRVGNCTVDGKMSWLDVQKLAMESLCRDGEAFIIEHRGASFQDSIAFQFIEPDMVDEQKNERLDGGREIRMGVELDRYKRPIAYHVLNYHPGDYDYTTSAKSPKHQRIPASRMIHLYMSLRAGQTRGEPWMAPVIPALKQLGGFREAAVINARVGASKMGFLTTPGGDGFVGDDIDQDNAPIMEVSPGTIQQLATGQEFKEFNPTYPSGEFDSFHKAVLKGIASGLGVSYTALSNDLEATSYSSIRQGALEERDHYKNLQQFFLQHFVLEIFKRWLGAAMEVDAFGIPLRQYDRFFDAAEFRGRAWSWVDPQKEMRAAVEGMKAGVLSLQDVASQYGKDTEELLAQIQRDKALMEQFGVSYALEPYAATFIPVPPDGVEQEVSDGDV